MSDAALHMPRSLSPSSVSSFRDCPRAFQYAYVERLPQAPTVPASKGTLVHRALELLYERVPDERVPDALVSDVDRAAEELAPLPEFAGLELSTDDWGAFLADAHRLAQRIFELEDPRVIHPIGLELKLESNANGVRLRGIIDRLELDADGGLIVTDYKSGSVPRQQYEASKLQGVHFYSLLCETMLGKRPSRVQLLYLSKPEAIIATPSPQTVRGAQMKVSAVWSAVERACANDDFRPNPGRLCDWCSYRSLCPAFNTLEASA